MSKTRTIQSNFTSGELADTLRARTDTDLYYNGCAKAQNVVILPHGGLRRRPGLAKIIDSHQTNSVRIESFEFSITQDYLILFEPSVIKIFKDGILQSTEVSKFTTSEMIKNVDVIQSADTMIMVHEDVTPQQLQRQGSDTSWAISDIILTNIPRFDYSGSPANYINLGDVRTVTVKVGETVLNSDGNSVNGLDGHKYQAKTLRTDIDLSAENYTNGTNWTDLGEVEEVWSDARGWPRTATFFQGRLWFGGSKSKINSLWASVPNDFFNFEVGDGAADNAIFDTIDSDQFNAIQGIYAGRHLQVFTTGGEFYNTSDIPIPEDSGWKKQTSYGSLKHKPISVDGATLYADRSARTIRQFVWSFNEDSYISTNITLKSSHIVNDIQGVATLRGTADDISDFVYVVNGDGTVAVMNTMRLEDIQGWTHWNTDGDFIDVAVVNKVTYFIVKRDGENFIEYLREGTYTDHNVSIFGTLPDTNNVTFEGDNLVFEGDNIVFTDPSTGIVITELETNYIDLLTSRKFKVIADGSILPDNIVTSSGVNLNKLILPRDAYSAEVGIAFEVVVKTLPLNVGTKENGEIVNLRKRVNRVILSLYKSLGVNVYSLFLGDKTFPVVLNSQAKPFTGIKEIYLFGYVDRLVEVEVSQTDALPFTLLSIDSEIEG